MRVGVSLTSSHAVSDGRMGARVMIERTAAARRAGLDSLFVGDHHATPGFYYQNVPLVAEQVGTLATLAPGRFIVQAGLGYGEPQFAAMGTTMRTRPSAFEQSLDAVRRLLAGETVSSDGRFKFREAKVALRAPEPVEYWIAGTAEPAVDRAARLGDGWLASPELPPDRARALIDHYRQRCRAHGCTPAAIAIRRDIYVGESDAEADATAGARVRAGYRGFPPEAPVYGSVERVAAAFRALAAMGFTDVIIRHLVDDQPRVLASYARLAEVRKAVADA